MPLWLKNECLKFGKGRHQLTKMKNRSKIKEVFFACFSLFGLFFSCFAQTAETRRIAFYNVENLFDTLDNPGTFDEDFLPGGFKKWNGVRLAVKRKRLYKVIASLGGEHPVAVLGLAEIETKKVLDDLICYTPLRRQGYQYIHFESPDRRGIDVALVFRTKDFTPLQTWPVPVSVGGSPKRDILYVMGRLGTDTLHIFVNHWTSRFGGHAQTVEARKTFARILRREGEKLLRHNPEARIVFMGDFNDNPDDESMLKVLGALKRFSGADWINLHFEAWDRGERTLEHTSDGKLEPSLFDQLIVSRKAAESGRLKHAGIYAPDWLFRDGKIYRSYLGPTWKGGYSDHLPVFMDWEFTADSVFSFF